MSPAKLLNVNKPTVLSFRTKRIEDYERMLGETHAPVKAHFASPNLFDFSSEIIISEGLCFSRTRSSKIKLEFEEVFDGYGLTFSKASLFSVTRGKSSEIEVPSGHGLAVDSKTVGSVLMRADEDLDRIAITSNEMHRRLSRIIDGPVIKRIEFLPVVAPTSPLMRGIAPIINFLYQSQKDQAPILGYPAAMASLRELIMNIILESGVHNYSDLIRRPVSDIGSKAVRRACDYIIQHAAEPITVADIAAASSCSVRSLQISFLKFKGISPMLYLKQVRLNGVRAQLLHGGINGSIAEIAYSWGFSHLSAFSVMYRKTFGEKPSETRQRSLGLSNLA